MRIAICSDTATREVNGIAKTLHIVAKELRGLGHAVTLVTPENFRSIKLPYGDFLVLPWYPTLATLLNSFRPDIVWIPTQGPLAVLAKTWCRLHNARVIATFHTRFPEYMEIRYGIPKGVLYAYARLFFGSNTATLVPSDALAAELRTRGFKNLSTWHGGVDLDAFAPRIKTWTQYPRPILLYAGRVVAEKNIEAFLRVKVEGTKIVVGGGKQLEFLRSQFPDAVFMGEKCGEELHRCYAEADVVVFPSLLDTFGLVILEALASGVPVAALPSPPVEEIFGESGVVAIDADLRKAIRTALLIDSVKCRQFASGFSWRAAALQFLKIIDDDQCALCTKQ